MARKPKTKPADEVPKAAFDEFTDDAEAPEEDVPPVEPSVPVAKMRDWRDVERYKEMRELKRLVGDDFDDELGDVKRRRR